MNEITKELLRSISDWSGAYEGAYNIRENGCSVGRSSSDCIKIENKSDAPGLEIRILPGTKGQSVSIPACVTAGGIDDLTYNDFYVGEDSDVLIIAGCGVHNESGEPARHNGIHRFFLGKGSRVKYVEKHIGTGSGKGIKSIDPVTEAYLEEGSTLEMDSSQIGGVDSTVRVTRVKVAAGARLLVRERILTEHEQNAHTEFEVELNGKDSGADIISRSVARDRSKQAYKSVIIGNAPCTGHSECDAIIDDGAIVDASPSLFAHHADAALIHEAAVGKIAGEQILKLRTLGLTEEEAEAKIIAGFLG